jgi:hypothetical protein
MRVFRRQPGQRSGVDAPLASARPWRRPQLGWWLSCPAVGAAQSPRFAACGRSPGSFGERVKELRERLGCPKSRGLTEPAWMSRTSRY